MSETIVTSNDLKKLNNQLNIYVPDDPINNSSIIGVLSFLGLTIFIKLQLPIALLFALIVSYISFNYFINLLRKKNIEIFTNNAFPPKYKYFKVYLISMFILFLLIGSGQNSSLSLIDFLFYFIIISIISIIIGLPFYIKGTLQNQKITLNYQQKILIDLVEKYDSQQMIVKQIDSNNNDLSTILKTEPSVKAENIEKISSESTESIENELISENKSEESTEYKIRFDPETGEKLQEEKDFFPKKEAFELPGIEKVEVSKVKSVLPSQQFQKRFDPETGEQLSDENLQAQGYQDKKLPFLNRLQKKDILDNLGGYILLAAVSFIILASISWLLILFPETSIDISGTQYLIAGDVIALIGVLTILTSEFVLTKMKFNEEIPLNYLGVGIGLVIGLLGLLIMRFDSLPSLLPELGLINSNWEFYLLALLFSFLGWIYAWRTPFRDLIIITLATGFIITDYALTFPLINAYYYIPVLIGLSLILIPGIQAAFSSIKETRFLYGSLITYFLLFLKTENILNLIQVNPILISLAIIIPSLITVVFLTRKVSSNLELFLLSILGYLPLFSNYLSFRNEYIGLYEFILPILFISIIYLLPGLLNKKSILLPIIIIFNGVLINSHIIITSLGVISNDSWFIILIPLLTNLLIICFLIYQKSLIEVIVTSYIWTFLLTGLFSSNDYFSVVLLISAIIITIMSIFYLKNSYYWEKPIYFISMILIISVGSIDTYLDPFIIGLFPILMIIFLFLSSYANIENKLKSNIFLYLSILVSLDILAIVQSINSSILIIEFMVIGVAFYISVLIIKQYSEMIFFVLLGTSVSFNGLLIYSEFDPLLVTIFSALSIVMVFFYLMLLSTNTEIKKRRQLYYDITLILLTLSIFSSSIILETYNEIYFLFIFMLFLTCNLVVVWHSLRYAGYDLTFGILLPSLLFIGKELFINQYLTDILLEYTVIGFLYVSGHAFILSFLSKRLDEHEIPLISPKITALFSIELILIVLFINKNITDYIAISMFAVVIFLIIFVNLIPKYYLTQFEFLIIQISTFILAIIVPLTSEVNVEYLLIIPLILPVFWFVLYIKVKFKHYILDSILITSLVITEYILSLKLPNEFIVLAGSLIILFIPVLSILYILFNYGSFEGVNYYKNLIWIQIPIWINLILLIDFSIQSNIFWSQFIENLNPNDFLLLAGLTFLFSIFLSTLQFIRGFQYSLSPLYIVFAITTQFMLLLFSLQLFLTHLISDLFIQGLVLTILLTFMIIIPFYFIRKDVRLIDNNIMIIIVSFLILGTVSIYFISYGLLPSYLMILGTFLILITTDNKRIKTEHIYSGSFMILFAISKLGFDIINNFDALLIEIAISSSITAICFLLIGFIINNLKFQQVKNEIHQN